ncbi:hypothetical protein ACVNSK_10650 [Corynebacterium propinquum]|nr:hypothetical protein [Corynebacterium propinquum]MCT1819399.1 hypothetical protein [Corynebacterium propinquum]
MNDAEFWKKTAQARTRLAALALFVGVIIGIAFAIIMGAAPVTFDEAVM